MNRVIAVLVACSSAVLALASCHGATSPLRTPVSASASALPAGVEGCALIGDTQAGRTCAIYDTQKRAFSETPDGTPLDLLARRVFLYERWMDLYTSADRQVAVRNMTEAMAPGDPESRFGDAKYLGHWDDQGDSAGFGDTMMLSVLFHYAVSGNDAEYARMESWVRGQVRQWDSTGLDGYLARFTFAGVPPGTPIQNTISMDFRSDGDDAFDVPASALPRMPDYYTKGIDLPASAGGSAGGSHIAVRPSWYGHVSIDAYSGPLNSWPLAFPLIKDPALKARMALHYGCFLKRLRIFKIINLSKNAALQKDIANYLGNSNLLKLDPGDPDLTKIDQVWAFYLPQWNNKSAATYPLACPAHLATDALPEDTIDVTRTGFDGQLLDLVNRQTGQDAANSMDFAFYPSVRGGDAVQLTAYALGAYELTGDQEFLTWRDQVLIGKANAKEVSRTIGSFEPPRPCRSYYRTANVYTAHFMRTLLDNDSASRDFAALVWRDKFAAKEEVGLNDGLFEVLFSAALGVKSPGLAASLTDLTLFGGAPGHLDDPRRNYAVDYSVTPPPPGVVAEKASADELRICSTPITVLGVTIPTEAPDASLYYLRPSPPASQRPPDNWIWEKDPFKATHAAGDAGHQQYTGLDLTEPYWVARYFGLLPDPHLGLAWRGP